MKVSVTEVIGSVRRICRRFPWEVSTAAAGTLAALFLVDIHRGSLQLLLMNITATAFLGLLLYFALTLISRSRNLGAARILAARIAVLCALGVYFLQLDQITRQDGMIQLLLAAAGLAFLVAVAPFSRKGEAGAFWEHTNLLGRAAVLAGMFSALLFLGLSAALGGIVYLLGIDIDGKFFARVWVLCAGFVSVLIFLLQVPAPGEPPSVGNFYHKALEFAGRFLLAPLVILYFAILYLYIGKIIFQMSWPRGGVAGFVLAFCLVGLVTLFLLQPMIEEGRNRTFRLVDRWFYPLVLPLSLVLFLAVWRRVSDYGVTVPRYLGLMAAFWLAGLSLLSFRGKVREIRWVPLSLGVLALLAAFGPWSAVAVSVGSQVGQLKDQLERNGVLVDGVIDGSERQVEERDLRRIRKIVSYLKAMGGYEKVAPWFAGGIGERDNASLVVKKMGVVGADHGRNLTFLAEGTGRYTRIEGYDHLLRDLKWGSYGPRPKTEKTVLSTLPGTDYRLSASRDLQTLYLERRGETVAKIDLLSKLQELIEEYGIEKPHHPVPQEKMVLEVAQGQFAIRVNLREVNLKRRGDVIDIRRLSADILLTTGGG